MSVLWPLLFALIATWSVTEGLSGECVTVSASSADVVPGSGVQLWKVQSAPQCCVHLRPSMVTSFVSPSLHSAPPTPLTHAKVNSSALHWHCGVQNPYLSRTPRLLLIMLISDWPHCWLFSV